MTTYENYQFSPSPCPTFFCQCETMGNPYNTNSEVDVAIQVYIIFTFSIVIVVGGLKMGLQWFIFKDYYPLKQKSPILCILLIISISGQLVLYPVIFITNYFTGTFENESSRFKFRSVQSGLQFSIFIIYLIRCLRISYAHDTHSSLSKSLAFRIFKKEYLLALFIGFLGVIKSAVVVIDSQFDSDGNVGNIIRDFALPVQLQTPLLNQFHLTAELQYIIRSIVTGLFWHCVLSYCMWLHKSVNERYSMKYQLLLVLIFDLMTSAFSIVMLGYSIFRNIESPDDQLAQGKRAILFSYCQLSDYYPTTQLIKTINLLAILWISILKPLREKKIYHVLLPTGRHYGFIKTMRDFLMQQEFLRVFTQYLKYLDEKNQTNANLTLLEFWKKMILIKLDRKQAEIDKLESIRQLIQSVQQVLFVEQSQLILNLKDSIIGLQQSISNSDIIKQKYRQSINEKVDELQKIALERLDKIYMKSYSQTESYFELKKMTDDNKRVNLNMIMLNLALIVDSENEFS